jgi:hypothetical protein
MRETGEHVTQTGDEDFAVGGSFELARDDAAPSADRPWRTPKPKGAATVFARIVSTSNVCMPGKTDVNNFAFMPEI